MNYYRIFLFSLNILSVFCLEPIQECKYFENWISKSSIDYTDFHCCNSEFVKCDESQSHIIEM